MSLPFNPTPSFPSAEELRAICAPTLVTPCHMLRRDPKASDYAPEARPLDPATLASQSMPRSDAGVGASLWGMFSETYRPHPMDTDSPRP